MVVLQQMQDVAFVIVYGRLLLPLLFSLKQMYAMLSHTKCQINEIFFVQTFARVQWIFTRTDYTRPG